MVLSTIKGTRGSDLYCHGIANNREVVVKTRICQSCRARNRACTFSRVLMRSQCTSEHRRGECNCRSTTLGAILYGHDQVCWDINVTPGRSCQFQTYLGDM